MRQWWIVAVLGAAVALALPAGHAAGRDLAGGTATGNDFREASEPMRALFALLVAKRVRPGDSAPLQTRYAVRINLCLTEAVTVRGDHDRAGALAMRQQPLAELAALCALMEQ